MRYLVFILLLVNIFSCTENKTSDLKPMWIEQSSKNLEQELTKKYGNDQLERITRGLSQIADYWQSADGEQHEFETFVRENFVGDSQAQDAMFLRFQDHLEKLSGHMDRIVLNFRWQADLDIGLVYPFDELFAAYNPSAHISSDFFENKLAFVALLNFPLSTLDERSTAGRTWTRREWAERRLVSSFAKRIPADISMEISRVESESGSYISNYNIWMHHLIDQKNQRLFPPKLRLLSHWNLRDEIRAQYAKGTDGLERQKMIQQVMERIIDQTIPEAVINNPALDWNPYSNKVALTQVHDAEITDKMSKDISGKPEPNTRYNMLRKNFLSQKSADPYWPSMPNFIQRRFAVNREIPEARITKIFDEILTSENFKKVGTVIKNRLGRDLEPFDIWYNGFKSRAKYSEEKLNQIVSEKYPTPQAFKEDIPRILRDLAFPRDRINEIANLIVVDPARGSGHAWGAKMRGATTHLRTRINKSGMDYKGYNIAIHELGHNVEQVISLNNIDYTLLKGVPNTAFTEAMAFVFQARDLELLGLQKRDEVGKAMHTLSDFWATCEIAAVALVDNAVWHWMYEHPAASPADIREATLRISREMWNRYFTPVFGIKDVTLLGIYSHMISYPLYLTDYPLGHLISYQIEEQIEKSGKVGPEFDRMVKIGNIGPDLWMVQATGNEIGADALQIATSFALKKLR